MAVEELLRRAGNISWSIQPRLLGNPDERAVWLKSRWYSLPLYVRPFLYFGYRYVCRLGFLEGRTGFLFHFLQAFWFRMVVDAKLSELEHRVALGDLTIDELIGEFGDPAGRQCQTAPLANQAKRVMSGTSRPDPTKKGTS